VAEAVGKATLFVIVLIARVEGAGSRDRMACAERGVGMDLTRVLGSLRFVGTREQVGRLAQDERGQQQPEQRSRPAQGG
jgi:hypothetical protein